VTVANLETTGTTVSNALPFAVSGSSVPATLVLSTQALNASYDTSLGGGALLYNPVVITVNGSTNATYYYSISFTGSAVVGLAINGQTGLTSGIAVPSGPTSGHITGEPNGGLGQKITGTFTGPVNFVDEIRFVAASILGAGTYADTITVNVCIDAQCSKPIAGSPQSIAVNYTVTGNPISNGQISLEGGSLVLEAPTSGNSRYGHDSAHDQWSPALRRLCFFVHRLRSSRGQRNSQVKPRWIRFEYDLLFVICIKQRK